MSAQMNNETAKNPLVGKTVVVTYETGAPGHTYEIDFFSNSQKTSTGRGTAEGYVSTDDYEMAVVAPNVYMVSWMGIEDGHVVTTVWNLNDMKAYSTYSDPEPTRISLTGITDVDLRTDDLDRPVARHRAVDQYCLGVVNIVCRSPTIWERSSAVEVVADVGLRTVR